MKFKNKEIEVTLEKLKGFGASDLQRGEYADNIIGTVYTIDIGEITYCYDDKKERNADFAKLQKVLK